MRVTIAAVMYRTSSTPKLRLLQAKLDALKSTGNVVGLLCAAVRSALLANSKLACSGHQYAKCMILPGYLMTGLGSQTHS